MRDAAALLWDIFKALGCAGLTWLGLFGFVWTITLAVRAALG